MSKQLPNTYIYSLFVFLILFICFFYGSYYDEGMKALFDFNTRQLTSTLWPINFYYQDRMMCVVAYKDPLYVLHACKKQNGKAEQFDFNKAISRAKELGRELRVTFIKKK